MLWNKKFLEMLSMDVNKKLTYDQVYSERIVEQTGVLPFDLTREEIDVLEEVGITEEMLFRVQNELNIALGVDKLGRLIQDGVVRDIIINLYQKGFRGNGFILELKKLLLQQR